MINMPVLILNITLAMEFFAGSPNSGSANSGLLKPCGEVYQLPIEPLISKKVILFNPSMAKPILSWAQASIIFFMYSDLILSGGCFLRHCQKKEIKHLASLAASGLIFNSISHPVLNQSFTYLTHNKILFKCLQSTFLLSTMA